MDDNVEVHGLASADGKMLNGRRGLVVQFIKSQDRYEVSFGQDRQVILRPANLRRFETIITKPTPKVDAPVEVPNAKADSLTSLLGFGQASAADAVVQKAEWQSVWERSGSGEKTGILTDEQKEAIEAMQAAEEQSQENIKQLRAKVVQELAQAGVFDDSMIELTVQEQLNKQRELAQLPKQVQLAASARAGDGRGGRSRSRSSASSRSRSASLSPLKL